MKRSGQSGWPSIRLASRWRSFRCAALLAPALVASTAVTVARPLDEAACNILRTEQARLEQTGTRTAMGKGPDWARSHASVALLNDIARLIEVDESLSFRCPRPKPVIEASDDADEADGPAEAKAKDGKSAATTPPAPKPKPKPKPKPAAKKAAPKPKPKINDAYVPPPKPAPSTSAVQKAAPAPRPQPR